jgi:hypothetical protein
VSDLDGALERMRARVEERRRSGDYPPGLEEELARHFEQIAGGKRAGEGLTIREQLEREVHLPVVDTERLATAASSFVPGGPRVQGMVARLLQRQAAGILGQVAALTSNLWRGLEVVAGAADEAIGAISSPHPSFTHLVAVVDALLERVADYERAPSTTPEGMAELARRVERLERAEAARDPRPWFRPGPLVEGLTDDPERVRGLLEACQPVLDLDQKGPGDLDRALDSSLGGLVALDVVERLGAQELLDLVRQAGDKLRPGGRLVFGATNPRSLWGLAHGSAGRPDRVLVDPGWLSLCCREAGFSSVEVEWGAPPPGREPPAGVGEEAELARLLFAPPRYLVVATR